MASVSKWLVVASGALSAGVWADFLVMEGYPSDPTCSSQENIEASVMIQIGQCLQFPGDNALVGSYEFSSCSNGADAVSVTATLYNSDHCSSNMFPPQEYSFDIPSGCINGTQVSCQASEPYALTEGWPAFGLYVDDASCTTPTLMAAFSPNCNNYTYMNYSFSTSLTCSDDSASFALYGLNESLPYNGCSGSPTFERSMVPNQCTSFANFEPIPLPDEIDLGDGKLKEILDGLNLDASSLYYYADCGGGENIPGIDTSSDTSSSSDDDDISDGMLALYLVLALIGGVALTAGGFLYFRRARDESSIKDGLIDKSLA